jgi:hypothetical protein
LRHRSEPTKPVLIGGLIGSPNTSWERRKKKMIHLMKEMMMILQERRSEEPIYSLVMV